jgi:hypothetical protein
MKKISLLVVFCLLLLSGSTVFASPVDELNARVAARQEAGRVVSQAELDSIANKCFAAQGRIASVRARSENSLTANNLQYDRLRTYLASLKLNSRATGDAEVLSLAYIQADELFDQSTAKYLLELSDLVDMDCRANPAGFFATLEAARNSRKDIITQGQNLREQALGPVTEYLTKQVREAGGFSGR